MATHSQEACIARIQSEGLQIPILDKSGRYIGHLNAFTEKIISDHDSVVRLCDWRNAARANFLSTDFTNYSRTQKWLRNQVFATSDRLMFWIEQDAIVFGHIGFRGLQEDSAEPDNLIRGCSGGAPDLMIRAKIAMLNWMFRQLGISRVYIRVLKTAVFARQIYKTIGYVISEEMDDGILKLELDVQTFRALHQPHGCIK